ncbi:MAG: DUF3782 domain-containing protein [Chloroflexus sp.]|nr:DUF3782 domain-containing protein [Chloroflexus sp.]
MPLERDQIRELIIQELPALLERDPEVQRLILQLAQKYFAGRSETDSRFDRILEELRQSREEQARLWAEQAQRWAEQAQRWAEQDRRWEEQTRLWAEQSRRWEENQREIREMLRRLGEMDQRHAEIDRKWEEQTRRWEEQTRRWAEQAQRWEEQDRRWEEQTRLWAEQSQRWEEQTRLWAEQSRRWEENQREIRELMRRHAALDRKFDSTIGALGARWGLYSEQSFRDALRGILTGFFNLEVINVNEFDETGEVFGRPEQIELDVIIKNGLLLICEIKSSMSKADMYLFERKARWYERRHERKADRLIVISPMVDAPARKVAERFGIVVYSFAEDAGDALTNAEQ